MKKAFYILCAIVILVSVYAFKQHSAKGLEVVTLEQLQKHILKQDNTLYVVNFWATWCKPCITEMPYFEAAGKKFAGQNVKVVLVSMDFLSEKDRVAKFVEVKKLESDVYLLNAGNPNDWIDKVESTWSGSLPATIMYKNGEKVFFREGDFTQPELDSLIQTKIN